MKKILSILIGVFAIHQLLIPFTLWNDPPPKPPLPQAVIEQVNKLTAAGAADTFSATSAISAGAGVFEATATVDQNVAQSLNTAERKLYSAIAHLTEARELINTTTAASPGAEKNEMAAKFTGFNFSAVQGQFYNRDAFNAVVKYHQAADTTGLLNDVITKLERLAARVRIVRESGDIESFQLLIAEMAEVILEGNYSARLSRIINPRN